VKRALTTAGLLLLLALPLIEVAAHAATRLRVPPRSDWQAAARFVRERLRPDDLITAAPAFTDPLLRRELGDRVDLAMAGRSDTAGYERLWALSIRGAHPKHAPAAKPELSATFGRVAVQRWQLGKSAVRYDLVSHVRGAQVSYGPSERARACPWLRSSLPRGGGLGFGVLPPAERFSCEGRRNAWVAPVVLEDLDLQPRSCIYQPASGREPLRVTFDAVPFSDQVVFHGGLYYEHERMRDGAAVRAKILRDDRELGLMTHRDGDGWKRLVLRTTPGAGRLTVEVSADDARRRSFCWSASVRSAAGKAKEPGP
jgi:hypothetical protein